VPDLQVTRSALKSILGVTSGEVVGDTQTATWTNKTMITGTTFNNSTGNILRGGSGADNINIEMSPNLASVARTGLFTGTASTSATGILATNGITAIGTNSNVRSTAEGFIQQYATGAVANNNAGLRWTAAMFRREWGAYLVGRFKFSSTSDVRVFIGWSSDFNEVAGETTLNNFSGAGVGKRATDTNWFTQVNDGDATEDRVDTGIAFAASTINIELALDSTSFRSRLDSTINASVTTELPAAATDLGLHIEIETGAGAADKNIQICPFYVRSGLNT
jgi:hypothetical protein